MTLYKANIIVILLVTVTMVNCTKKQSGAAKKSTGTVTSLSTNTATSASQSTQTSEVITIACSSAQGTTLYVVQNQPVSWVFTATSSTGGTPTLNITASPQPQGMQISGGTVNFTPVTQQDLVGTISVAATGANGGSQSSQFSWSVQTNGSTTGGLGGGLSSIFPMLLQMGMQFLLPRLLSGGAGGGIF